MVVTGLGSVFLHKISLYSHCTKCISFKIGFITHSKPITNNKPKADDEKDVFYLSLRSNNQLITYLKHLGDRSASFILHIQSVINLVRCLQSVLFILFLLQFSISKFLPWIFAAILKFLDKLHSFPGSCKSLWVTN